jgi:hypothetical protein
MPVMAPSEFALYHLNASVTSHRFMDISFECSDYQNNRTIPTGVEWFLKERLFTFLGQRLVKQIG